MNPLEVNTDGHLHKNIIYFARALRRAGMRIGTAQVHDAVQAVAAVGFTRKLDFYVTLRAIFVTRVEDLPLFAQTFQIFWRDPEFIQTMMQALMPMLESNEVPTKPKSAERRAQEAIIGDMGRTNSPPKMREEVEIDSSFSFSDIEKLGSQDFEQMSLSELAAAEAAIKAMHLPVPKLPARRLHQSSQGKIDPRATFREARRQGGEILSLPKRKPQNKPPRLVLLVDISGSMSSYSRMVLLFAHALKTTRRKSFSEIHVFTFGTRLTNVTRRLEARDPDKALSDIGQLVQDWGGGTAICENIDRFVKDWSRRVLGSDSVVILVSDGLERGDKDRLSIASKRLQLSCRQLIWMNPLLRYDGFEPSAGGIAALLPNVDRFIAAHNLKSFHDLADCLSSNQSLAA